VPAPQTTGEAEVVAYSDDSCGGDPQFHKRFNGCCTSLELPSGQTVYGKAGCDNSGQAYFLLCEDSYCNSCEAQELKGDGVCGAGFGVVPSAKITCVRGAEKFIYCDKSDPYEEGFFEKHKLIILIGGGGLAAIIFSILVKVCCCKKTQEQGDGFQPLPES
jgi:hypothetical protein